MEEEEWKQPSVAVLVGLASLFVHQEEYYDDPKERFFDGASVRGILANPEIKEWIESVPKVLKPLKRSE